MTGNKVGKQKADQTCLFIGPMLSLAITLVGTGILAKFLDAELLEETAIGYGAMIIIMLSSWIGAMAAIKKGKGRRIVVGLGTGGLYFLILLGINGLVFDGMYAGVAVTALLVICGSLLAVLSGTREKRAGKSLKRKRALC